ncbi:hypothetical protein ABR32_07790 [Enterobacter cloacae subsp. dissolvens]|uniref:Uncharacterized protein n=1 Tax=Enterobacter cloacae TaxID=550 RepID=A0A3R9AFZ5_ENTCL|nr:hypothetical protein OA44_13905 [Enterobacter cloacae]KLQ40981.1 hypothetical protein ABR32_07790 [Enterobacter cloacae subsp. dissolvens]PDP90374.1 hypothetical protein CGQ17_19805 [Enterobacter cloacae]RHI04240.1 hypothetical protein DW184_11130 [Enterobacter cloacae]RSB27193.1 hypothetical protein EGK68_21930 [Enterobacter cloacae]
MQAIILMNFTAIQSKILANSISLLLSGLSHAVTKLQDHIQNGLSKEQKYSNAKSEVIAAEQSIEIAKFM